MENNYTNTYGNNNQQGAAAAPREKSYWMPLATFFTATSKMSVVLVDSSGKVLVKIAKSLDGATGRPTKGVAKFDYNNELMFSLTPVEIQAIVSGYYASVNPISFVHPKPDGSVNTIFTFDSFQTQNGMTKKKISIIQKGANGNTALDKNASYVFNDVKVNMNNDYMPAELNYFINVLDSVTKNTALIASKLLPEAERRQPANNNNGGQTNYYGNNNNNAQAYGQQATGYAQPAQQAQTYQAPQTQAPVNSGYATPQGSYNQQPNVQQQQQPQNIPNVAQSNMPSFDDDSLTF